MAPGTRALILPARGYELIVATLALFECGALASVLPLATHETELRERRLTLGSTCIIGPGLSVQVYGERSNDPLGQDRLPYPGLALWSSGSTGAATASCFSLDAVLWNASQNAAEIGLTNSDRSLVVLPWWHSYCLVHQIISHLVVGASLAFADPPTFYPGFSSLISRFSPTNFTVVPAILRSIVSLLSTSEIGPNLVRQIFVGGGRAPSKLISQASRIFPKAEFVVTYGLTEAGPRVTTRRNAEVDGMDESYVGRPLHGIQIEREISGELLIKTPSQRAGFLRDGKFVATEGPIRTGDCGYIDEGRGMHVLGRVRRQIDCGGRKLNPADLENALLSIRGVMFAHVFATPHSRLGETPSAKLWIDVGEDAPSEEEIRESVSKRFQGLWSLWSIEVVPKSHPRPSRSWKDAD